MVIDPRTQRQNTCPCAQSLPFHEGVLTVPCQKHTEPGGRPESRGHRLDPRRVPHLTLPLSQALCVHGDVAFHLFNPLLSHQENGAESSNPLTGRYKASIKQCPGRATSMCKTLKRRRSHLLPLPIFLKTKMFI